MPASGARATWAGTATRATTIACAAAHHTARLAACAAREHAVQPPSHGLRLAPMRRRSIVDELANQLPLTSSLLTAAYARAGASTYVRAKLQSRWQLRYQPRIRKKFDKLLRRNEFAPRAKRSKLASLLARTGASPKTAAVSPAPAAALPAAATDAIRIEDKTAAAAADASLTEESAVAISSLAVLGTGLGALRLQKAHSAKTIQRFARERLEHAPTRKRRASAKGRASRAGGGQQPKPEAQTAPTAARAADAGPAGPKPAAPAATNAPWACLQA